MTNGAILLLLIIAAAHAAPIIRAFDASISFPEFAQKVSYAKVPSGLISNTTTDRDSIYQRIRSWNVPVDDKISEQTYPTTWGEMQTRACEPRVYSFKHIIRYITRADFDPNSLLPGSLLQLVNAGNFAKGVIPVFISETKRNPMTITLSNGINETFVATPNQISFRQQLNSILAKYLAYLSSQPIQVYVEYAPKIESILRQLGLSNKIYEDLLIAADIPDKVKNNQGRIVIVLFQKLFSASLNLTKNGAEQTVVNLVQTVFSPQYTYDQFGQVSFYGYWGAGNLPLLVNQANFGRLLVLSIDNNANNQRIMDQFSRCFNGGSQPNQACFESSMSQIQRNPTVRFYAAGVDLPQVLQRNNNFPIYRETVNWKKVFSDFTTLESLDILRPLSASTIDLLGQKYFQVQTRYFSILNCAKSPNIRIRIREVERSCEVRIKRFDQQQFTNHLFTATVPQNFNIESTIGWEPFDIKFILQGSKKRKIFGFFRKTEYINKLTVSIDINGVERKVLATGNRGDNQEYREFSFKIDPKKETVL